MLFSWWIPSSYLYDFKNYIFEIRMLQGSEWYITFLRPFKFNLFVLFRSGVCYYTYLDFQDKNLLILEINIYFKTHNIL